MKLGRKRMDEMRKREHERSVTCCITALLRSMKSEVDWSEIIELDRHLGLGYRGSGSEVSEYIELEGGLRIELARVREYDGYPTMRA